MIISRSRYESFWFSTLILLLLVQYVRPQELIPGLHGAPVFLPIAALVLIFIIFSSQVQKIFNTPQLQLVTTYLIFNVVMIPFSQLPGMTVTGITDFVPLLPFVFSVPLLVTNTKRLHKIIDTFIIISLFIAIVGLLTHGGGRYQLFIFGNFLTDPNDFALFMVIMLPISLFLFIYEKRFNWRKLLYLLTSIMLVINIIASYSRGGFLGLVAVFFVVFVFSPNKRIISMIAAIGIVCILAFTSSEWTKLVSTSFDTKQSTAQTRLETWELSIDMFIDHPYGVGINNTPGVMHRYSRDKSNSERWWGNVSHSFWFTALAEGGVIGFLIIIGLLFTNVHSCVKLGNMREFNSDARFLKFFGRAYLTSMIGFLVSGTFLTVNYYPHLWYMTGMIAAGYQLHVLLSKANSK